MLTLDDLPFYKEYYSAKMYAVIEANYAAYFEAKAHFTDPRDTLYVAKALEVLADRAQEPSNKKDYKLLASLAAEYEVEERPQALRAAIKLFNHSKSLLEKLISSELPVAIEALFGIPVKVTRDRLWPPTTTYRETTAEERQAEALAMVEQAKKQTERNQLAFALRAAGLE